MTFSLVARDDDGTLGVAVASKFLGVGALVPAAQAGAGALATQALANLRYRPDGLTLLGDGRGADDVITELTTRDPDRDHRQLGVVDAGGGAGTYTGAHCLPWAGGRTGPGWAAQGNILTGPEVIDAVAREWTHSTGTFASRLVGALLAGDRAGGDARGRQSAALLLVRAGGGYGGGSDVLVDLRVDDHPDPVVELGRLRELHELLFTRPDPADCLPLEGEVAAQTRDLLTELGYDAEDLDEALETYAGVENLEERLVPGRIDPAVLDFLRRHAHPAPPR